MKRTLFMLSLLCIGLTACAKQEYTGDKDARDCWFQPDGSQVCETLDMQMK